MFASLNCWFKVGKNPDYAGLLRGNEAGLRWGIWACSKLGCPRSRSGATVCIAETAVVMNATLDRGCCIEIARPTAHYNPTYVEEGILHYCVANNTPSAVACTSTLLLISETLPYLVKTTNTCKALTRAVRG